MSASARFTLTMAWRESRASLLSYARELWLPLIWFLIR